MTNKTFWFNHGFYFMYIENSYIYTISNNKKKLLIVNNYVILFILFFTSFSINEKFDEIMSIKYNAY